MPPLLVQMNDNAIITSKGLEWIGPLRAKENEKRPKPSNEFEKYVDSLFKSRRIDRESTVKANDYEELESI